jgi:L-ascorbate metabolism protein UlaG (beta-lactamase superfamily)
MNMKTQWFRSLAGLCLLSTCVGWLVWLHAQDSLEFTSIQRLTNNEIALTLNAPTGINYRIDTTTNLPGWEGLVTLPTSTSTSLQHTDSAAPYLDARFYRAAQLTGSNILTGDHLVTTNGDVVIHPIGHATFVMSWNGKMIYNDPTNGVTAYQSFPKADLILLSHTHTDHFSTATIDAVRNSNAVIIASQTVYNSLTAAQKTNTVVLGYGASTNVMGLNVEAVYAFNSNHSPLGFGNGYVLTVGGKRIYVSGDTGNATEIRALTNIDVAFVCINQPYTMTVTDATNAVRAFRPKVVYPYHYRDSTGTTTNAANFKQRLGSDLGIEVRLRKWY